MQKGLRNQTFDIAKAIGIIAMVSSHAYAWYPVRIISRFFMALFVFCSGYFINMDNNTNEFFVRRLKGLYIPFVKYCAGFAVLHLFFYKLGITDGADLYWVFKELPLNLAFHTRETLLVQIWFIPMLFMTETFYFIVYRGIKKMASSKIAEVFCISFGGGHFYLKCIAI